MAALVSVQELQRIEGAKEREKKKGLSAAIGAWEDFEDLEREAFFKGARTWSRELDTLKVCSGVNNV